MDDLKGAFCGVEAGSDEAIEAGWTPYFYWDEATRCEDPVCPSCAARHLLDFESDPIVRSRGEDACQSWN